MPWLRLYGQSFSVFKWKDCSASRSRGGGNVKIGFIDFQGLVGRAENSSNFFRASHETDISTAFLVRVKPPKPLADGGSIPGQASALPGWNVGVGSYKTQSNARSCFSLRRPSRKREGKRART